MRKRYQKSCWIMLPSAWSTSILECDVQVSAQRQMHSKIANRWIWSLMAKRFLWSPH